MDASLIDANASNNSVIDSCSLKKYLNEAYLELDKRLEEKEGAIAISPPQILMLQ